MPLSAPVSLIWSWPHLQTTENDSPVSQGCGGYALRLQLLLKFLFAMIFQIVRKLAKARLEPTVPHFQWF